MQIFPYVLDIIDVIKFNAARLCYMIFHGQIVINKYSQNF